MSKARKAARTNRTTNTFTANGLENLERRLLFATFGVTTAADAGAGSLRQAILDANASAGGDTITFAIGSGAQTISPATPLPPLTDTAGVIIDGRTQPGFAAGAPAITIDGGSTVAIGFDITGGNSTIRGLAVQNFTGPEITMSGGGSNTVQGNLLVGGQITLSSANNRIGAPTDAERNVVGSISVTDGGDGTIIENNRVNTNAAGTAVAGSPASIGIHLVGSPMSGGFILDNLVAGCTSSGITLQGAVDVLIEGNTVGTDAAGTAALPNNGTGITLDSSDAVILDNLISGNSASGVTVANGSAAEIRGNRIGTNAAGTAAIANGGAGILLGGTSGTQILDNQISGNTGAGIDVGDPVGDAVIQANLIGTDAAGTGDLGNGAGILWGDTTSGVADDSLIGGTSAGQGNTIAFNDGAGVAVIGNVSVANSILGNSIFSNAGLGIDIGTAGSDGRTANDADDSDSGANDLQNFPVLTEAVSTGASTGTISGTLQSRANLAYRIEFFSDTVSDPAAVEGRTFLGFTNVTTNGSGLATFSAAVSGALSPTTLVTATATNPGGSTSEFADALLVGATGPDIQVSGAGNVITSGDDTPGATDLTNFGNATLGGPSVNQTFTITNTGGAALDLAGPDAVTISGPGAAQFAVLDQPNTTIGPNQSAPFTIAFTPAGAGTQTATVSVASNDADENPYTFAVAGQGVTSAPVPEIEVSGDGNPIPDGDTGVSTADLTNFGNATISGAPATATFTISNPGTQDLTLGTITLTGAGAAQFAIAAQPAATVGAGQSTTFTVRFNPAAGGPFQATVNIPNNDADENPYDFTIRGVGVAGAGDTPTAQLLPGQPAPSPNATTYDFTVRYTDDQGISVGTLGAGDVVVTGPNGFSQPAAFVQITSSTVAQVDVVYRIDAPGGTFDAADAGTYTVTMQANEVSDTSGNDVAAGNLGTFEVAAAGGRESLGRFGVVDGRRVKLTVLEPDGTVVTLGLSNGSGEAFRTAGGRLDLEMNSSDGKFTASARRGNRRIELEDAVVTGSLRSFAAKAADATGVIRATQGLTTLNLGSLSGATVSTPSAISKVTIAGDMTNAQVWSGANLGDDGRFGGAGASADAFAAGSINKFTVNGSVTDSLVAAGLDPVDAELFNGNGVIVGGAASRIGSLRVKREVDAETVFAAGAYPAKVKFGNTTIIPGTDARFDMTP